MSTHFGDVADVLRGIADVPVETGKVKMTSILEMPSMYCRHVLDDWVASTSLTTIWKPLGAYDDMEAPLCLR